MSGGFRKSICEGRNQKGMSRLNEKLKFRVSPEDVERIKVKMEDAGIMSMSAYIRKMALDGICVRMDLGDVRQLVILLRRCSNNLEQYARKANETGSVYAAEPQFRVFVGTKTLLATLVTAPETPALFCGSYLSHNGRESN